ncbi:MAG: nucleotidyl transferase AbiEii/AbiGii toxin family protein [Pseudomonadota bacterium]
MTKTEVRNLAASIHQRLLNVAAESDRPFNEVLQYFAMERFLYRLSSSEHAQSFVLKGALLFRVWDVPDSRATRDIDFLAFTSNSLKNLAGMFREICSIEGNDGLEFDPDSVTANAIKENAEYQGARVRFTGLLGKARITMQADVGFGDRIHPAAVQADYPVILDLPAPSICTYPAETVIAEKVEAMIHLGTLNSRMKDFYDIWRLSREIEFDPAVLSEAIRLTLKNRETKLIACNELVADLLQNDTFEKQWSAFLTKTRVSGPESFREVLDQIAIFLTPIFDRAARLDLD